MSSAFAVAAVVLWVTVLVACGRSDGSSTARCGAATLRCYGETPPGAALSDNERATVEDRARELTTAVFCDLGMVDVGAGELARQNATSPAWQRYMDGWEARTLQRLADFYVPDALSARRREWSGIALGLRTRVSTLFSECRVTRFELARATRDEATTYVVVRLATQSHVVPDAWGKARPVDPAPDGWEPEHPDTETYLLEMRRDGDVLKLVNSANVTPPDPDHPAN